MLMPERQRLGGEHRLDQPLDEQLLDDLLEGRQHAGVVCGDAALQAVQPVPVAEHAEVLARDRGGAALDDVADPLGLLGGVEPQLAVQALLDRRGAAGPAEDEGDGRQQALGVQPAQHVRAADDRPAVAAARLAPAGPAAGRQPPLVAGQPLELRVHLLALEQVVEPRAHQHVLPQRHRPVLLDDDLGVAAHRCPATRRTPRRC
jgi:hypothetical protein